MLRQFSDIKDFALAAEDGEIGKVKELSFEDLGWIVRYIVVNTGSWLTGRKVLLSPRSFGAIVEDSRLIAVHLTKAQIEESPPIDADKPVSRQFEQQWSDYYGYPGYWLAPDLTGFGGLPIVAPGPIPPFHPSAAIELKDHSNDPHLRSTTEVLGYAIHATDGDIGHLDDFLIDDHDWIIRYVIVSRSWWKGRKVILSSEWINEVNWDDMRLSLPVTRDAIMNAPQWDDGEPITRDYEQELHDFYRRQGYWSAHTPAHA